MLAKSRQVLGTPSPTPFPTPAPTASPTPVPTPYKGFAAADAGYDQAGKGFDKVREFLATAAPTPVPTPVPTPSPTPRFHAQPVDEKKAELQPARTEHERWARMHPGAAQVMDSKDYLRKFNLMADKELGTGAPTPTPTPAPGDMVDENDLVRNPTRYQRTMEARAPKDTDGVSKTKSMYAMIDQAMLNDQVPDATAGLDPQAPANGDGGTPQDGFASPFSQMSGAATSSWGDIF